jgi:hypothetical protein
MSACPDEKSTRHYLGRWYGFGPVRDGEQVLFAVFDDTGRDGASLASKSFNKNLNNTTQSVARSVYVSKSVFQRTIVGSRALHGVASAHVGRIRDLRADLQTPTGITSVRSICVVDLVERGDCEGHATMGFSEAVGGVSPQQLGKVRERIRMDLANTFSRIMPIEAISWPSQLDLWVRRILCVSRVSWSLIVFKTSALMARLRSLRRTNAQ